MTLIDFSQMTDAHIDNLIGEQIMHWNSGTWGWDAKGRFVMLFEQWNPTRNVEQASQVLDLITQREDLVEVRLSCINRGSLQWWAYIHVHKAGDYALELHERWQRALCQAALRMVELETHRGNNDTA